ncbi:hypothetical protein L6452_14157 [Arctium lappa]|uniref:Uncharacterized protein n=1 Tax=Arctium lappa TaxID=4217 RepID=A0ACB9CKL6_ARCLA|nr:hypothetical protein L6452_14157 [Arctium lappa]
MILACVIESSRIKLCIETASVVFGFFILFPWFAFEPEDGFRYSLGVSSSLLRDIVSGSYGISEPRKRRATCPKPFSSRNIKNPVIRFFTISFRKMECPNPH